MRKILFLTPKFPFPPKDGFRARIFNLIKNLSLYYDITILSFIQKREKKYIDDLSLYCDIFTVDKEEDMMGISKNISLSFVSKKPFLALQDYSKIFENKLKVLLKQGFDFVFFEGIQTAQYRNFVRDSKTVLDLHNPEHIILKSLHDSEKNPVKKVFLKTQLEKLKEFELLHVKKFDKVLTVSEKDAYAVGMANFHNNFIVPNGCAIYDIEFIFKQNLLYVGSLDYPPNEDGLLWFLNEIFPKIKDNFPDIQFYIVGKNPPDKIKSFESSSIKVLGYVDDILPFYNRSSLFVVPLRIQGGASLKILNAMSFKKCVLSTKIGAEGLGVEDNKNIFLADDSEKFASKIISLLRNPDMAKAAAEKGYDLVRKKYDWKIISENVRRILDM